LFEEAIRRAPLYRAHNNSTPGGLLRASYTITIVQADIPAGYTAIVAASKDSSGQVKLAMGTSPSPGPSCVNSTPITVYPG
jgi:hypothetical protein